MILMMCVDILCDNGDGEKKVILVLEVMVSVEVV